MAFAHLVTEWSHSKRCFVLLLTAADVGKRHKHTACLHDGPFLYKPSVTRRLDRAVLFVSCQKPLQDDFILTLQLAETFVASALLGFG